MKFIVETSAKHIHVTQEHWETLFGTGFDWPVLKELSQPGQYATGQKVKVVGPKGETVMSILGPARPASQVELSLTDARGLGVVAPIKESGDIAGTPGCKLVGSKGEVEISQGVIIAKRHLHTTPDDATKMGIADKEIINVKVTTEQRTTIFGDVVVRVNPNFATAMHIDTDESNACAGSGEVFGEIIKL